MYPRVGRKILGQPRPAFWHLLICPVIRMVGHKRHDTILKLLGLGTLLLIAYLCSRTKEPFDYVRCRDRGFGREFCTVTPLQYIGPGQCVCESGETGTYSARLGAKCDCPTLG